MWGWVERKRLKVLGVTGQHFPRSWDLFRILVMWLISQGYFSSSCTLLKSDTRNQRWFISICMGYCSVWEFHASLWGEKVKSIYFGLNFPNDTELTNSLLLLPSYFLPWHDLQFKMILISLILGFVQPLSSSSAPTRYFSPSPFKPSFSWLAAPCKQKHQAHRALWFLSFWLARITSP